MKQAISRIFFILLTLICFNSWANYPEVPKPFRYVSDYTQTLLPNEWQTLETALADYATKTSSQIAVVIVPTTHGEAISSYTHNLFNQWGIGQAKQNNGVLLLIAKDDRKLFIATGRGLEVALPDAIASSIIRNDITPYFKQNAYAQGIAKGLSSIIAATQGEYAPLNENEEGNFHIEDLLFFLFFAFVIFLMFNNHRKGRRYISPSQVGRILTNRRGSFGGSRGFGSSRSGGFGGGSTGGGGAGGSW